MEEGNKGHLKGEYELEKWNRPAKNESVLENGAELVVGRCGESVPELVVKLTPPSSAPALAASSGSPFPGDSSFSLCWVWAQTQKSSLCRSSIPAGSLNLLVTSLGLLFLTLLPPNTALETCCFQAVCSSLQVAARSTSCV